MVNGSTYDAMTGKQHRLTLHFSITIAMVTFTDVSAKASVNDPNAYYGFTPVFADFNNDGKLDLVVADDSTPNYLYINKGNGTFE